MKKMNLLAMSLVSAAALSFSSCSSNDDLGGGAGTQSQVKGFYMTLAVQTPTSNETRTSIENPIPTEDATAEEAAVKNGTFYLVDEKGSIVFSKALTGKDWTGAVKDKADSQKDGQTILQIQVENVAAGATYKVYFKAGSTKMDNTAEPFTIEKGKSVPGVFTATGITQTFTSTGAFAKPCDTDNNFSMFNQNDATTNGNGYTVTFTDANKVENNPAKVMYKNAESAIKIERVTARVDVPTSTKALLGEYPANASQALKNAIDDAKEKVSKIELVRYALSNVTNKTYVMQNWNKAESEWSLLIPDDATLSKTKNDFGEKYLFKDGGFKALTGATNDYIFENNKSDATAMYFEYKVTLDANQFKDAAGKLMPADFQDGTFYRYNNVIYTSFDQIMKAYADVAGLFEGKSAAQLKTKLEEAKTEPTAETAKSVETKLSEFRAQYGIEVFNKGLTYYKQVITDKQLGKDVIQRNTIYRLNVNKIFNVGAQVPNGEIDKNGLFYLDVTVTVNPWVLNTQDVSLGD
ncbi:fimbria major subunit [Segatella sinensis]|uniref:Fimbria major subunit n=1 Tax=Segatella sinensis TaxID=3085167 RepID=A0ABV1G1D3_9BACT